MRDKEWSGDSLTGSPNGSAEAAIISFPDDFSTEDRAKEYILEESTTSRGAKTLAQP
jgi:hypothetical protein